jgi:hypothetical protein
MRVLSTILAIAFLAAAEAAAPVDFSGTWLFKPDRSENAQMMASVQYTSIIGQQGELLTVHDVSVYQGQKQARDTHYDLGGRTVDNESPMGDPSKTVSHWDGARLVTQWTSPGAIAGTTVVRTETRWLSADGKTMSVSSSREGRPPMVLVFERQ